MYPDMINNEAARNLRHLMEQHLGMATVWGTEVGLLTSIAFAFRREVLIGGDTCRYSGWPVGIHTDKALLESVQPIYNANSLVEAWKVDFRRFGSGDLVSCIGPLTNLVSCFSYSID